ncbi:MAG: GIY-YIG nuclease family protein [Planctomycetota bacterium]|jgi:putative endonuclease
MTTDPTWSLYLVRTADDALYTGIATDVDRRFEEHSEGVGAKYLRGRGPLELVFRREVGDRSLATRLELRVKALSRGRKEALVADGAELDELLEQLGDRSESPS